MISFIPPHLLVCENEVMMFILDYSQNALSDYMFISEAIIYHSSNGVIVLEPDLVIKLINPHIHSILGYIPDQLQDQPLEFIIPNENSND
jgi:PAS domain-containing protein